MLIAHFSLKLARKRADAQMYQKVPAKIAKIMKISWQGDCEQTKYRIFLF